MAVVPPLWLRSSGIPFDVVAMGASAGGLRAVQTIVSTLDAHFPAAILLAQHRASGAASAYRRLVAASTRLRVEEARSGHRPVAGSIYVAPDDCHLELAADGTLCTPYRMVTDYVRPSVDRLFASVGGSHGSRAVGVVLTGYGRDGALGVTAIRSRGGFVIAQDARTSEQFGMPASAIETRRVDLVLPLHQIAFALTAVLAEALQN